MNFVKINGCILIAFPLHKLFLSEKCRYFNDQDPDLSRDELKKKLLLLSFFEEPDTI